MGGAANPWPHEEKLDDGSGIDHLSDEFFATVDPLIGQAFGLCA